MKRQLLIILAALLFGFSAFAQTSEPQTDNQAPVTPRILPGDAQGYSFEGSTGRLGVLVAGMTPELRQHFGAPEDAGVLVSRVEPGSAAQAAGIQVGDVIVQVAGQNIPSPDALVQAVVTRPGEVVDLTIVRQGQVMVLTPQIQSGPASGYHGWWYQGPPGLQAPLGQGQVPGAWPPEVQELLEQIQQQMQVLPQSNQPPWPLWYHYFSSPPGTQVGDLDRRLEGIEQRLQVLEQQMRQGNGL